VALKPDPKLNHLLEVLSDEVFARLLPDMKLVDLPLGKVIYEPGTELKQVYFPPAPFNYSMLDSSTSVFYKQKRTL
jgi:hypothetical protein